MGGFLMGRVRSFRRLWCIEVVCVGDRREEEMESNLINKSSNAISATLIFVL